MKKSNIIMHLLLIAFLLVFLFACSKKDDDSLPLTNSENGIDTLMTATINGLSWKADSIFGGFILDKGSNGRGFSINGISNGKLISCGFADYNGPDSNLTNINYPHLIPAMINYSTLKPNGQWNDNFYPQEATFKISKVDELKQYASGTFSGKLINVINGKTTTITDGKFQNIHYIIYH